MSYSHGSNEHSDWVLALATRLKSNGVDACLNRWDATIGGNLAHFTELAANSSYQIIAIISKTFARKADEREGDAEFEAQILSARLYNDLGADQVIPLIRNNSAIPALLPAFLSGRFWIGFRGEESVEVSYEKLLGQIHQVPVEIAPLLGANPFAG